VQEAERLKDENLRRAGACKGDMEKILKSVDIELYGVSPDERKRLPSECGKGRDHGGGGGGWGLLNSRGVMAWQQSKGKGTCVNAKYVCR